VESDVQYCRSRDGTVIAYTVTGSGDGDPVLVLRVPWVSVLEPVEGFFDWHLVSTPVRVVRYSPRGTGLSDRDVTDLSLEARLADLDAVADAVGARRYMLYAITDTALTALAWTAANPGRVASVLLQSPAASGVALWDTPRRSTLALVAERDWEMFSEIWPLAIWGWEIETAARRRYAAVVRRSVTREMFLRYVAATREIDVASLIPSITTPALVMTSTEFGAGTTDSSTFNSPASVRAVAAALPNMRLVATNPSAYGAIIREFVGVEEPPSRPQVLAARDAQTGDLRTILFTDIERHTEMIARLGDTAGREVLREHERITREALRNHGGSEVKAMGDGFLAWFPSATGAIECAIDLQQALGAHNAAGGEPLSVRVGINAGEPVEEGGDLYGHAVITASRVAASAHGGEIVVTDVVRQLVAGKDFLFADRGQTELRGFDEPVRTWALVT